MYVHACMGVCVYYVKGGALEYLYRVEGRVAVGFTDLCGQLLHLETTI